jgi:hypothetical protein
MTHSRLLFQSTIEAYPRLLLYPTCLQTSRTLGINVFVFMVVLALAPREWVILWALVFEFALAAERNGRPDGY